MCIPSPARLGRFAASPAPCPIRDAIRAAYNKDKRVNLPPVSRGRPGTVETHRPIRQTPCGAQKRHTHTHTHMSGFSLRVRNPCLRKPAWPFVDPSTTRPLGKNGLSPYEEGLRSARPFQKKSSSQKPTLPGHRAAGSRAWAMLRGANPTGSHGPIRWRGGMSCPRIAEMKNPSVFAAF